MVGALAFIPTHLHRVYVIPAQFFELFRRRVSGMMSLIPFLDSSKLGIDRTAHLAI